MKGSTADNCCLLYQHWKLYLYLLCFIINTSTDVMQNGILKNCFMLLILLLWFYCLVWCLPNLCASTLLFDNVLSLSVFVVLITALFYLLSRSCIARFGPSKILVLCTYPPIKKMLSSLDEASLREKHLGKIMRTSGFVYFRNSSGSVFHFSVLFVSFLLCSYSTGTFYGNI